MQIPQHPVGQLCLLLSQEFLQRHEQRWLAEDACAAIDRFRELGQRLDTVSALRLIDSRLSALLALGVDPISDLGQHVLDVQMGIPHFEVALACELDHGCAVRGGCGENYLPPLLGGEPVVAPGNGQTGRQPLDVPFERAWVSLVEIVDVEDQSPFR